MRKMLPIQTAAGVLICGLVLNACSRSPVAPSPGPAQPREADPASILAAHGIAQTAGLSPDDVVARGWDCRPAPTIPNRVTCSPPNHDHPVLLPGPPPPADRPATFTLLVFDSGVFIGTDLLIREDLYRGQPCRAFNGPYRFIPRIGYYECLHLVNGS